MAPSCQVRKQEEIVVIGITGGVGCGKSTVVGMLEEKYGAKVLIADDIGHEAMEPGSATYEKICTAFGTGILREDNTIDRKQLADIIYGSDEKRKCLNDMIHPFVFRTMEERLRQWQKEPLVVIETAILFETGCDRLCHRIWCVTAGKECRIRRLSEARGYTREKSEAIMAKQMGEEEMRRHCDVVIYNDGDFKKLENQLQELLGIK